MFKTSSQKCELFVMFFKTYFLSDFLLLKVLVIWLQSPRAGWQVFWSDEMDSNKHKHSYCRDKAGPKSTDYLWGIMYDLCKLIKFTSILISNTVSLSWNFEIKVFFSGFLCQFIQGHWRGLIIRNSCLAHPLSFECLYCS